MVYLQFIHKKKCTRCAFGIPDVPVLNPFNSLQPQCVKARELMYLESTHTQAHTSKAVGSGRLCFKF